MSGFLVGFLVGFHGRQLEFEFCCFAGGADAGAWTLESSCAVCLRARRARRMLVGMLATVAGDLHGVCSDF